MKMQTFDDVWDAIEDNQADADAMRLRSTLMSALQAHITTKGWTQREAAQQLHVTQPRISDLVRGKITLFGLESLIALASAAGLTVELSVRDDQAA
jgi:predicted XRE-type DNA-binding protein